MQKLTREGVQFAAAHQVTLAIETMDVKENKYPDGTVCNVIFKAPRKAISFRDVSKLEWSEERKRQASEIGKKFVVNGIGIHAKRTNNT